MEKERINENESLSALKELFKDINSEQITRIEKMTDDKLDINLLLKDETQFIASNKFYTSNSGVVEYVREEINSTAGKLKLLHEIAHKLLRHSGEESDKNNLENERVAWLYAVKKLQKFGIEIDNELASDIIDCLNTYKEHIKKKSVCIACGSKNTNEFAPQHYTCKDCYCDW